MSAVKSDLDLIRRAHEELDRRAQANLKAKIREFGIPELPHMPAADDVILWRLPPPPAKERTEGGIVIPGGKWDPDSQTWVNVVEKAPRPKGVLLAAGLEALDWLFTHGIFIGDTVGIGRWEGQEHDERDDTDSTYRTEDQLNKILELKCHGIRGSVESLDRIRGEKPILRIRRIHSAEGVLHVLEPVPENILGRKK